MTDSIGHSIGDLARLMRRRFDEETRDLGVTNPQWRALFTIFRRPGINQGALAEIMEVEPITTCRMVDRLELAGLVERRRDPHDRRAWQIFLTDAAMPVIDKIRERAAEFNQRMLSGLSGADTAQLTILLDRIRQNLSDHPSGEREARHG